MILDVARVHSFVHQDTCCDVASLLDDSSQLVVSSRALSDSALEWSPLDFL